MNQIDRNNIKIETALRHCFIRFKEGCKDIHQNKNKCYAFTIYLIIGFFLWVIINILSEIDNVQPFSSIILCFINLLYITIFVASTLIFIILLGTPIESGRISTHLQRIGLLNHAGEVPFLVSRQKDQTHPRISILEFETEGIPKEKWVDKQSAIESALNVHIAQIAEGNSKSRILLYIVPSIYSIPSVIEWKNDYLSPNSFILLLGEGFMGKVTVDLSSIPHLLIGGSTGSGKSILLKLLLMQSLHKGAKIYISDFKGGIDFPKVWHDKCSLCTDEENLLKILTDLVDELQHRKSLFLKTCCVNIDEYNTTGKENLKRIIFACDEVAEMLDKTGRNKADKEILNQIESRLATIARQGRAFGIHLILATQRPDATIIPGQIRNNIDFRVCGRADNVLSQIILDNTSAADQIPKDAKGRFITGDGTVFQGYIFDENNL